MAKNKQNTFQGKGACPHCQTSGQHPNTREARAKCEDDIRNRRKPAPKSSVGAR